MNCTLGLFTAALGRCANKERDAFFRQAESLRVSERISGKILKEYGTAVAVPFPFAERSELFGSLQNRDCY
ncbi:MAG: hypothetical protein WBW53_16650 [Terriglobales bacterium]